MQLHCAKGTCMNSCCRCQCLALHLPCANCTGDTQPLSQTCGDQGSQYLMLLGPCMPDCRLCCRQLAWQSTSHPTALPIQDLTQPLPIQTLLTLTPGRTFSASYTLRSALWEQVQASVMQHSSTALEWDYPMVTCGTYISPSCARLLAT